MSRLSTKRRIKRILYSKPVIVLLLIVAFFSARAMWDAYSKMSSTGAVAESADQKQQELAQKKEVLERSIDRLETPAGIEEELREKYSVAKEGERMVVIVDEEPTSTTNEGETRGFWQRVWGWITWPFN